MRLRCRTATTARQRHQVSCGSSLPTRSPIGLGYARSAPQHPKHTRPAMCSACGAQQQLRNGVSGSVPVYARLPPQNQCCLNRARVPPKNQRCLGRISARSSSLLAHTSIDTLCRCVCHGSAPFVGCGTRLGKRCRNAGYRAGDGQPPPHRESMTAGEASRELAALF